MVKTIYCPRCGRKVAIYDGKGKVNVRARCHKCEKDVVYNPNTDETKMTRVLERNCSSGVTFW